MRCTFNTFRRLHRAASHLQKLVEFNLGYAVTPSTVSLSNDVRKHLLEGCKQTALPSSGQQIVGIASFLRYDVGEGEGRHLYVVGSAWTTHVENFSKGKATHNK